MFSKSMLISRIFNRSRCIISVAPKQNLSWIRDNIVHSRVPDIQLSNLLIHEFVWDGLDKWRNKTALVCAETGRQYTYQEVYDRSKALATFLRLSLKLNLGDTVAVLLPNVPEYAIILLGALRGNLKITTINPSYTKDEIQRQLLSSNAKIIFTLNDLYAVTKESVNSLNLNIPIVIINQTQNESIPQGTIKFGEITENATDDTFETIGMEETAFLPYSSGTTGLPKGVELTHRNIVANLQQYGVPEFKLHLDTDASHQDVIPVILPVYHIYGLMGILMSMLVQGCKLVMVPKFSSNNFMRIIEEYKPNILHAVPPIILMILNNPNIKMEHLQSLRQIVSGAAPLGSTDVGRLNEKCEGKINFMQIYGMTESAPLALHASNVLENGVKVGASGIPVSNTQCKIVGIDDDSYTPLDAHVSGELLIKGPQIMKGYHNNEEATANTIVDGWLKTGDIAHYDEDGQFFITDRLKELIKVKGFQVAPAELETLLRDHPAIADAAVTGVAHKDFGEAPKAFVVVKAGSKLTVDQINEFVNGKVAKYKQLTGGIVLLDSIPKTASGKILRRELKFL